MTVASTLTENAFSQRRKADWQELDRLTLKTGRGIRKLSPDEVTRLSPLYRSACADLAAAEAARYSAPLVEYLRALTAAAHRVIYGPHASRESDRVGSTRRLWLVAFPRAVRHFYREMLLATALFFLPLAIGCAMTLREPAFAFRVAPEAMLRPLADAYAKGFHGRDAGENMFMAGFYVYNNVGIALRCFATGIFGGIGSVVFLLQNGLSIGAILGFVASEGAGQNIVTFIVGHGSLELGAIVLAGGSGLALGWSVIAPGDRTRIASLQRRAREVLVIIAGASVMLVLAAGIEAFWSSSSAPIEVKLGVGGALFFLVMTYILVAGRNEARPRPLAGSHAAHPPEGRS